MRDGLHILDVIVQPHQLAEAEHRKHFHGRLLLADEFRLDPFQTRAPGDLQRLADESARQPASARCGMHRHAYAPDLPFPAAQLLVQRRHARDFSAEHAEQRQVARVVNVLAPVMDHRNFRDTVLDEHPFRFGYAEEQLVKILFIRPVQRAQRGLAAVLERDGFRKLLEFEFYVV